MHYNSNKKNQFVYVMGQAQYQVPQPDIQTIANPDTQNRQQTGEINLWTPYPPMIIDLRFNNLKNCPFQAKTAEQEKWLEQQLYHLKHFDQNTPINPTKRLLTSADIQHIKQTNPKHPNITLFIHGYNVEYGAFGKQIYAANQHNQQMSACLSTAQQIIFQEESMSKPIAKQANIQLEWSNYQATIYRDIQHNQRVFKNIKKMIKFTDRTLNGFGAHNWWLHFEYNINKAAGFNGFTYHYQPEQANYTRMIQIAWLGNPKQAMDYIAIEPVAAITAYGLVDLIKQLDQNNISINIIAHSAGNIVLIKAMQLLAEQHPSDHFINNVFLWDAAMPSFVLSPNANQFDHSLNKIWHTQQAYQAAKRIYILYSHYDNVLGPIPVKLKSNLTNYVKQKITGKVTGKTNARLALLIQAIDQKYRQAGVPNCVNSAYQIAQLFQIPFSELLYNTQSRNRIYQYWLRNYQGQTTIKLTQDLIEQVKLVSTLFPEAFRNISLIIAVYIAIQHDGLLKFFANPVNRKHLNTLLLQVDSQLINSFISNLTLTFQNQYAHTAWTIFMERLNYRAKTQPVFTYLYRLATIFLQYNNNHLISKINQINDFMLHKTFDLLFSYPPFIVGKPLIGEKILAYLKKTTDHQWQQQEQDQLLYSAEQVAALVITVFHTPGAKPYPAMGYSGPLRGKQDLTLQQLINQGKIKLIDQTAYLYSHSAMKNPSVEAFEQTYQKTIIQSQNYHFGNYF